VHGIVGQIAGYHGAINRIASGIDLSQSLADRKAFDAIFWYYHHSNSPQDSALAAKAVETLQYAVKVAPDYALAWSVLGFIYLSALASGYSLVENPAKEALRCALTALKINPECQHAYLTLGFAHLHLHHKSEALWAIEKGLSINPNMVTMKGSFGIGLIFAGEFERGKQWLEEAIEMNPFFPWYFNKGLCLCYFHQKKFEEALFWAQRMMMPKLFWDPLLNACCFSMLGRKEEAIASYDHLLQLLPDIEKNTREIIGMFFLSEELVDELANAIEGLKVIVRIM
jgi:tetratricopeptide (TPR) repeat protein